MKLDGIAPKKLRIVKPTEIDKFGFAAGGYHPTYNKIYINEKLLFEMSQKRMLDILAHELKHCEQHTNMCRLAGMTPDKYARVLAEGAVNRAINGGNGITGYFYKRAVQEGNGQKFIEENVQNVIRKNIEKIKSAFASVFKAPKISPDSPEGKKALLQLESLKTYGGYSRHYEEPIEIEAHEWGNKIKNFFQKFLELKL
ncbi:MAG: hypothetical protein K6A44_06200 [bacterium]|nr:hypothetical protein [bacterium]